MNNGDEAADLRLAFKDIPGVRCARCHVRDIWARRDLGDFDASYLAEGVAPHAAPFLVITPSSAASPPPPLWWGHPPPQWRQPPSVQRANGTSAPDSSGCSMWHS